MTTNQRTVIVQKRGRKWFTCVLGGHQALLLIDEVTSASIAADTIVTFTVAEDLSKTSRYGTSLAFRAGEIISTRSAEAARAAAEFRKSAERWVGFAAKDLARGNCRSPAVEKVLSLDAGDERYPAELAERIRAVQAEAPKVASAARRARDAEVAAEFMGWAEEQVHDGVVDSKTITNAMLKAQGRPELADRLDALKAGIAANAAESREQGGTVLLVGTPPIGVPTRAVFYGTKWVVYLKVVGTPRITEDDPSFHGHHLLGHEGDRGVLVRYRPATPEEIATAEAAAAEQRAARAARVAARDRAQQIHARILREGEKPTGGLVTVAGDKLMGGPDPVGGGAWFVITGDDDTPERVWAVRNNGGDGDTWDRNNVRTGGAGAVGAWVPATPELVTELRAAHAGGVVLPGNSNAGFLWGAEPVEGADG